jgi:NitT/TauT family transport system substrate-binding protein
MLTDYHPCDFVRLTRQLGLLLAAPFVDVGGTMDFDAKLPSGRRTLLAVAGAVVPALALLGRRVLAAEQAAGLPPDVLHPPLCAIADLGPPPPIPAGPPRKVTLAWNEAAICTAAVPVAMKQGFFKRYNLDVSYINFAGSTDQLLEAIATGKADGATGMALRWLKPLEQGFDVKLVAGLHAGCMHMLSQRASGITQLSDLRGKTIGVGDMAAPDKNFFGIMLQQHGIDPDRDVTWQQFPGDLLPLALQKGQAHAITGGDPLTWLWRKNYDLIQIASNMDGRYGQLACCVIGLRGNLVRNDTYVADALTRAILEAGAWVADHPDETGEIFAAFAPKASPVQLATMLREMGHCQQAIGLKFRSQIAQYADLLKLIGVFRHGTDSDRFASRVTTNVVA